MGYSLWGLKGSDTTEVTEHAHHPISWVSTPSGQPPLSQLTRALPRPPPTSQASPHRCRTRSPSGVFAVSCLGRLHWFPTRGLIWTFLWGPCRVHVLQEQVSPGVNGRCSGHRAPCFCVQLCCDMMLAHGGLQEVKGPQALESSGLTVSVNSISAPAAPGRRRPGVLTNSLFGVSLQSVCIY